MLVSSGTASAKKPTADADEAVLLEALAEAGDALTAALIAHDLDGITEATRDAEALIAHLEACAAAPGVRPPSRDRHLELASRIADTARRNAVLLESAWATDATILRLLATAAVEQEPPAPYGTKPAPGYAPAGWLDRSA